MNNGTFTLKLGKDNHIGHYNTRTLDEFYYMLGNTLNMCLVDTILKDELSEGIGFDNAVTDCNDPIVKKLILDPEKVEITIKIPNDVIPKLAYSCGVIIKGTSPVGTCNKLEVTYDYCKDKVIYTLKPAQRSILDFNYMLDTPYNRVLTYTDFIGPSTFTTYDDIRNYLNEHSKKYPPNYKNIISDLNAVYNLLLNHKYSDREISRILPEINVSGDKRTVTGKEEYIKNILVKIYEKLNVRNDTIVVIGTNNNGYILYTMHEKSPHKVYILTDIERELEINIFRLESTDQTINKEEDKMKNRTLEMIEEEQRKLVESIKKEHDELEKMYGSGFPRSMPMYQQQHIKQQMSEQEKVLQDHQQPVYQQPHMMQQEQYMAQQQLRQQQPYASTRGPGGNPGSHKYNGPAKPTNVTDYDGKKIGITITMNTVVELATTLANDIKDFTIEPQPLDIPIPGIRFPMCITLKHKTSGHSYVLNNDGTLANIITSTQSRYSPFYTGNNTFYPANVPVEKQLVISALDFKEILEAIEAE